MAKKALSKKSFKTLFTKSEPNPDESSVKSAEKKTDEKKRFKLPKLKIKSKGSPSFLKQQVFSPAEPATSPVDGPVLAKTKSSIYASAPRSKAQHLSTSETNLHKPNKFATFSFSLLKKQKKKKDENLSRSAFGLHRPDIEEHNERSVDLGSMADDQGNRRAMLSMSQPALDTSDNFDIPSPPSVHSNVLKSYLALSQQTRHTRTAKAGLREHPTNGSDLLLHAQGQNSATADIPVQSEEKENSPVDGNRSDSHLSQPPLPDASYQFPDEAVGGNLAEERRVFQQSITDILIARAGNAPPSHHETNVLDTLDGGSPNDEADATESATESAMVQQDVLSTHGETSESADKTLPVSNRTISPSVNQDAVYGALYDSLFPRSFTSEALSSVPTSHADIYHETRTVTKSEPLVIETSSHFEKETNVIYTQTSSVPDRNPTFGVYDERPSRQRFYACNTISKDLITPRGYQSSSSRPSSYSEHLDKSPYSVRPNAGIKLNNVGLCEETSAPVATNAALPVSDYITTLGTDTRVTDSKRRAILVKEVVAEGVSRDSGFFSSKPDEVTAAIGLKREMDADQDFVSSPTPGLQKTSSMPCSPVYLSVGSDDGSTVDIYFSAEEDNMDSLDEQIHVGDKREDESFGGPAEVSRFEKVPLVKEAIERTEHFALLSFGGSERANKEMQDLEEDRHKFQRSQREEFQVPFNDRTEFFQAEEELVAQVLPQIKEQELPVTPVLPAKTAMVCELAAPSGNMQGHGADETWIKVTETPKWPLSEERNLPDRDLQSPRCLLQNNTRREDKDLSTYQLKEAEEKCLSIAVTAQEERQEHACNPSTSSTCALLGSRVAEVDASVASHGAELQSDAAASRHNRVARESEWADTIAESAGSGVRRDQGAVELSDLKADTRHPREEAPQELFGTQEQLPEAQADLKERSPTAPSDTFHANDPEAHADHQPDDKMYSGYSSLNATLSMKNSPPDKLHESGDRFRQVSPMRDNAAQREALAFGRTESNGATLGTESVRKSSFDGVSRFMPQDEPFLSGNQSYRLSDTSSGSYSSSVLPEAPSYSYSGQSEFGRQPKAFPADDTDASCFTGVFKATLVELDDPAAPGSTPPASPDVDCNQSDMDNLVDTLKSMGPSLRPRGMGLRGPAGIPVSALPPIVEDAPSPVTSDIIASPTKRTEAGPAGEARNGIFALPADLGLKRNTSRDTRSPMELMKKEQPGPRDMPLRATATQSILMRKSSDASDEHKSLNGNATQQPSKTRLENSVIYGSYKSSSVDQTQENSKFHRSVFRSGSLPELGSSNILKELSEVNTATDSSSRFERLSFLINSPPSSSSFSSGSDDVTPRRSLPLQQNFTSSVSSSGASRHLSPTSTLENHRLFPTTESSSSYSKFGQTLGQGIGASAISAPLQRSFSHESISVGAQQNSLINNNLLRGPQVQKTEPERNVKYRAFPDAYLTKEKEHGKLNPRPGKVYIFDRPGMCGQRIELCGDIADATSWELQETISIRVVRGGWVLYEQRNFKGEKIALDEGDIELTCPFQQPEAEGEQQTNGQKVAEEQKGEENGETSEGQTKTKAAKRSIIGSVRRAVRDYSVPEISLFPEENAEGKKVIFRDTSEDARIFGFPIKANSIIINAGLWLVFSKPFFEGSPRVLEVGGYSNPASWGVEQPYVGSLHPLKIGEPKVENISEPTIEIFERSYFTGKSRILTSNMKDFMTRVDRQQGAFMYSVGSLKVRGGIWVGYEKEGYRGHQYLLEEGEYHDWRVWGGSNSELRSVRVLQADLSDPLMVMFEQPEEEEGAVAQEENTFEVTEAIPDVELFGFKINTRSIQVFSGVWVAYSHVDFSGNQYILEKGFYSTSADWGSRDTRICSVQPVRLAPADGNRTRNEILLYSEPDYKGECRIFNYKEEAATEEFQTKSCRVVGGSWVLYENKDFSGTMYVLSEGGYRSLTSMGCPPNTFIRSVKAVPMSFSVPSISLFGLEGLEGREISTDSELLNMQAEGFNDHVLSVRVNSGW
ncbi:uncharacterized protein LOC109523838 isoform X4 [Hippocampus comes]|uniref:uncharacterized protein LOC109523838 isoform X4 n=1 Tax=Hippocampus comes TaxID=109280 RepID=UPI00094E3BBB|nr:PREDICTED: uncharacterized protein LOC109523838 isoform X4 [Hippocampus comes]